MRIFAHRGYSGKYPENTMLSFRKALEEGGTDSIELDVQLSKDGKMVIIHDETLDRTTNGHGFVKDHTLKELKELDASVIKPGFEPERIPDFEEYCEFARENKVFTNVELKTGVVYYEGIEEQLADYIKQFKLEEQVIFSSFNHLSALKMKKFFPDIRVGALVENDDLWNAGYYCKEFGFDLYHPDSDLFTKENFDNCKKYGIGVNVWTVNDLETFERLCEWGVDGIFTNFPRFPRKWTESGS